MVAADVNKSKDEKNENTDLITLKVGEEEFAFDVSTNKLNEYIEKIKEKQKISASFNFLMSTIVPDDKDRLKKLVLRNGLPNGAKVMAVSGALYEEAGAGIEITVKK